MKRSIFLQICAIGFFWFGAIMFFMPARGSSLLGLGLTPAVASLLHGMGGPIIGTGAMNFLFRKMTDTVAVKALLLLM